MAEAPPPRQRRTALLVVAHGSCQDEANADLYDLVGRLRTCVPYPIVEAAFLELAEPTISQAGTRCVEQGADQVILLPYFLSAGVHVRRDLADARSNLSAKYPHVQYCLADPLGRHPLLLEAVAQRAEEAAKRLDTP
jgi:sirohydrochlorin ferrochelatase